MTVNYHDNNKTDLNPDEIDNELDLCSLSSIENIGEFLNLCLMKKHMEDLKTAHSLK